MDEAIFQIFLWLCSELVYRAGIAIVYTMQLIGLRSLFSTTSSRRVFAAVGTNNCSRLSPLVTTRTGLR